MNGGCDAGRERCIHRSCPENRKSTRLNSSHLVISYAVFCLKKKNKSLPYNILVTICNSYVIDIKNSYRSPPSRPIVYHGNHQQHRSAPRQSMRDLTALHLARLEHSYLCLVCVLTQMFNFVCMECAPIVLFSFASHVSLWFLF